MQIWHVWWKIKCSHNSNNFKRSTLSLVGFLCLLKHDVQKFSLLAPALYNHSEVEFFHFVWQKKLQRILLNAARNSLKKATFDILGCQFSFSRNFLCLAHFGDQLGAVHKSFINHFWGVSRFQTHPLPSCHVIFAPPPRVGKWWEKLLHYKTACVGYLINFSAVQMLYD